jgi:hypothetical protein
METLSLAAIALLPINALATDSGKYVCKRFSKPLRHAGMRSGITLLPWRR